MITSHNITNNPLSLATLYFEASSIILKTESAKYAGKKTALTYMPQNPKYQSYRSGTCYKNLHTRVTQPCHYSAKTDPQEKEQDQNMSKFHDFLKPYQNIHHCSRHKETCKLTSYTSSAICCPSIQDRFQILQTTIVDNVEAT